MSVTPSEVAAQFMRGHEPFIVTPLGNGLINDTYLIQGVGFDFVLQRINPEVFPKPEQIMANLACLGNHIRQKPEDSVRLRIPELIATKRGEPFYLDQDRQIWRAQQRIHPAESRERLHRPGEAAQIGFALAHFHRLCADLPPTMLHDTLPGFHITPGYLAQHHQLLAQPLNVALDDEFRQCLDFVETRQTDAGVLENARNGGDLQERVIHGDPKLNNFLFRPGSDQIISLIDLDTVKPGLVHYDIADCLRSCCHDRENRRFDLGRCRIILENYLREAGDFFKTADYDYLYSAIWLIPFELGLRFFNDYLSGNRYFKTLEPRQNLRRAQSQFDLCASIERQRTPLQRFIADLKQAAPA